MMKRILFVDDESVELRKLRGALKEMSVAWNMVFAGTPEAAVELLKGSTFDAVVADLSLPPVEGVPLLEWVRTHSPSALRVALSSGCCRDDALRGLEVAHQHFAKQAGFEHLQERLALAFALNEALDNERIRNLVSQLEHLPTLPGLYQEILAALAEENPSIGRVTELISKDLSLCSKVLQVVNSTFFALHRSISSPEEAVAYLGVRTTKALVLSVRFFSCFPAAPMPVLSVDELWQHSLLTGETARGIAQSEGLPGEAADEAFTAGLLHDVGKLVLAANLPQEYEVAAGRKPGGHSTSWQAEAAALGSSHAEIGASLLASWGLPENIVAAVAFHHRPEAASHPGYSTVTAVHVANAFVHGVNFSEGAESDPLLDSEYLQQRDLMKRMPVWMEAVYVGRRRRQAG